ncbi:MAG TPA: hypothetical protein VNU97_09715 [Rhizomicrobium sp.]|jgi:hypothetical protein|nr:hypothetical protein [Rhizomicrobium sp.]
MVELETSQPTRRSVHIGRKPASNIHHAIRIAEYSNRPLNVFVTVNFRLTACLSDHESAAFEKLRRNHFTPWIRRNKKVGSISPTYIWVLERPNDAVGLHWALHLPDALIDEFGKLFPKWLESVGAGAVTSNAIKIGPANTPRSLGLYLLKGMDPIYAALYGVNHIPQGVIFGKRSGFSRNAGPSAKKRMRAERRYPRPSVYIRLPA